MDENARLLALRDSGLLDAPPKRAFDQITRLAAKALDVEIALVSLVDRYEQIFASRHGLEVTRTPREVSFCAEAIKGDDVFVVLDAAADARFCDNPLVTGPPKIRFYAGAPLETTEGHRLGTLCVIDPRPRTAFDRQQREVLAGLAATVMTEMQSAARAQAVADSQVVIDELKHRMGNTFAYVSSLISLMGRGAPNNRRFADDLRARIGSLGRAQALLAASGWGATDLRALVVTCLDPLIGEDPSHRIDLSGATPLRVGPRASFALSLLVSELATNSLKHGALATASRRVALSWREHAGAIDLVWEEDTTGESGAQGQAGFGTRLLDDIVPASLDATAERRFHGHRLTYRLRMPHAALETGDAVRTRQHDATIFD